MRGLLGALLGRLRGPASERSKDTARQRLEIVLIHDRAGLAPQTMEALRADLLRVISQYLVVDEASTRLEARHTGDVVSLLATFPIKELARSPAGGDGA